MEREEGEAGMRAREEECERVSVGVVSVCGSIGERGVCGARGQASGATENDERESDGRLKMAACSQRLSLHHMCTQFGQRPHANARGEQWSRAKFRDRPLLPVMHIEHGIEQQSCQINVVNI